MKTSFTNISHRVSELIFYFKNPKEEQKKSEEILKIIDSFNQYEYLYFINEVLIEADCNLAILKQFFVFEYGNDEDEVFNGIQVCNKEAIKYIWLRKSFYFNEIYKDYNNQSVSERLLNTLYFKNTIKYDILELKNQIIKKLTFLKEINDKEIISIEIEEVFNYENEETKEFEQDVLYEKRKQSLFLKIIEGINFDFEINDLIDQECLRIKSLHDLNKSDNHIFSILINGLDYWKKQIANDLLINETSFGNKKLFYLESLNEFQRRTSQNYIKQIVFEQKAINHKNGIVEFWSPDAILIEKLKKWLNDTFKSYYEVKGIDIIGIIENLPIKNKIIFSSNFSQPLIYDILSKFFETLNIKLTKEKLDAIQSFVSNFTCFDEKVHYKKQVDKIPYLEIDFIPQKYYKDFIKIFLILQNQKNGIIKSNITNTRQVLTALFYNKKENRGLSYESIRRIDSLKLNKELLVFNSYFKYILSSINRDYFLP